MCVPLQYNDVSGVGTGYWTVKLSTLTVGLREVGSCALPPHCFAIIDSGTTLIGLPHALYDEVISAIGHIHADCSNVDELPTLHMMVGNYSLSLPPWAYIAYQSDVEFSEPVHLGPFAVEVCLGFVSV